jgi:hypothetical protein
LKTPDGADWRFSGRVVHSESGTPLSLILFHPNWKWILGNDLVTVSIALHRTPSPNPLPHGLHITSATSANFRLIWKNGSRPVNLKSETGFYTLFEVEG